MKHWRDLSLRSKIFLCFGTLILLSTAAITLYAVSITISELDAYALQSMERNAQYVSREISALLRNTQMQSVLFASDKTVDEALAAYDAKTTLQKWESWSALQKNCTLWVATKQLGDIRIHFYASHQFLRDGIRFYEGVEKVSALAPNHMSIRSLASRKSRVRLMERTTSMRKQLSRILLASRGRPSPIRMAIRGEPPSPTREAKEPSRVTIGPQTPTPARAVAPITGILPMYIRSTML